VVSTPDGGTLVQRRPASRQLGNAVATSYELLGGNEAGVRVGGYDRTRKLVVDPVIESLTLMGGAGNDQIFAAWPGYIVGTTESPEFPGVIAGPHLGADVFIHATATGNTVIVGGSGNEVVTSVATPGVSFGRGYVGMIGGYTDSRDLPTNLTYNSPMSGRQTQYGGGATDGFTIFIPENLSPPVVTYVGGSGDDRVTACGIVAGQWPMVAGTTTSTDFPNVSGIAMERFNLGRIGTVNILTVFIWAARTEWTFPWRSRRRA